MRLRDGQLGKWQVRQCCYVVLCYVVSCLLISTGLSFAESDCVEATRWVSKGADLADGSEVEADYYHKAVEMCPKLAEAHHNLGVLHLQAGRFKEAQVELEKALALRDSVEFRLALAHVFYKGGNPTAAESEYRLALEESPNNARALQGLSVLLVDRGNLEEAKDLLERALEKNSTDEISLYNRAALAERVDSKDVAEKYYRELLKINPAQKEGVIRLALLLRTDGRLAETQEILAQALAKQGEDSDLQRLMASTSEELGDFDRAEVAYRKLLGVNPVDEDALINLSSLHLRKRQHQLALETLAKVLALNPTNAQALSLQGIIQLQLGRHADAEKTLEKAVESDPALAVAQYNLGLIYRHQGKEAAASMAIAKAKALDPKIVD